MATKETNLGSLLFGAYRRQVLALLLMHPEQSFHVREIARITAKPAGTLYRELGTLAEAGLLVRSPFGNQVHYRANPACPIYEELRGILRKTFGVADILREALKPVTDSVDVALIYGSVASGDERAASDVDVMIIGKLKFGDAVLALSSAEESLRREVNPHVYSSREFKEKIANREPYLMRVVESPKIFLIGTDDDLGKLAKHRSAKAT
ncbi:MAG: nucleotidyltransferase domain-containing protein [Burkholderiales bacterium]